MIEAATAHWDDQRPGWLLGARPVPSPNFDERPPGAEVELLVIHHISLPPGRFSGDAIERLFTNRLAGHVDPVLRELSNLRVSSHFLIRRRGACVQFVGCEHRAWHAGESRFLGRERCNDYSIGIELEGDSEHAFTDSQYRRLLQLTARLCGRFERLRHVAGHSDIAPGRKVDPGPKFDWARILKTPEFARLSRPF